jgi:N-succinyldiaminopimelate aminotransferase
MFMPVSERENPPPSAPARAPEMRSPFVRQRELLGTTEPGKSPISLAVGEPQHGVPSFVGPVLASCIDEFGKYPMNKGLDEFCAAAAGWLGRRFRLPRPVDPATEVLVLNGSREGLFLAGIAAERWSTDRLLGRAGTPAILMPNPFYGAYEAGAMAAHAEAVYLPATAATGFLPDLDSLSPALLDRTVSFYLASPANPQGSVASPAYFAKLAALARKHGFMVFSDECYSEIYTKAPPPSMLEHAGPDFENVIAFQSLSKRSNLPGLRVGFVAGDKRFLTRFLELRNVSSPQVPLPAQRVAIEAYNDETHVDENRRLYAQKFDLADQILGDRYGYKRPAGGFLLWLDVSAHGGDEAVTLRLWKEAGLRVIPGSYLAREQPDGSNPGAGYIRVAIVQDAATTAEALHRLVAVLG